ncbi:hypothetical protein AX14_002376 [Amanita brunnescens Koide BX004]|nr:hypothetical protein AX14_002376 [Amanita brunnescens Koide BX004]
MADNVDITEAVVAGDDEVAILAGTDVKVANPTAAAAAILAQVNTYLDKDTLISAVLRKICKEATQEIIGKFVDLNSKYKLVLYAVVVQERTQGGGNNYKEMGFEIDSDPENPKLKQAAHLGCEITWGKNPFKDPAGTEPWRLATRDFKMHAETVPTAAPFHRHQTGFKDKTETRVEWREDKKYRLEFWTIHLY